MQSVPDSPALRRLAPAHSRSRQQRLVAVATAIFLAGTVAGALTLTVPSEKVSADANTPRAVIIVGPSSSSTSKYLDEAEAIADQARDAGMDVTRIFHPRATWERLRPALQGANLVVYFGHGNGWPSPYAPFQETTKNGFGLNAYEGASAGSHVYYGGNVIREKVRLAKNAVVVLYRSCYASGNGEDGDPVPSRSVALQRVDNFAAAFLHRDVRAGAVMAFGSRQFMDLPAQLMEPDKTMDAIFRTRSSESGWRNSGWIGTHDFYAGSDRTGGARMHLDPHSADGYKRAITGDLELTTSEWLAEASEPEPDPSPPPPPDPSPPPDPPPDPSPDPEPAPDEGAPQLTELSASVAGSSTSEEDGSVTFSPDGDGVADSVLLTHRASEPSWIDVSIADATGRRIRDLSSWSSTKRGSSRWDGEDATGRPVPDGLYRISVRARDAAGARSAPLHVEVHALVLLRGGSWDTVAVHGADGDTLARAAAFEAELLDDATTTVRVEDAQGDLVRTIMPEAATEPGTLHVPWNGRGGGGEALEHGRYWAVASAATEHGMVSLRAKIWVGPYRVKLSDRRPRRGQDIRITVTATEPQGSSPRLTITQPGLRGYWWDMAPVGRYKYRAFVELKSGGGAGTVRLSVDGTDIGGQRDSYRTSFPIR